MNRFAVLLSALCLCRLHGLAFAQTPNDPETLFTKAIERFHEAKTRRLNGTIRLTVDFQWDKILATIKDAKNKAQARTSRKKLGSGIVLDGSMRWIETESKSRLDCTFTRVQSKAKKPKSEKLDMKIVAVDDSEKRYLTQIGAQMDTQDTDGMALIPEWSDVPADVSYRMLPAVTINGTVAYPIEVLDAEQTSTARRIFTIDPQTGRILRVQFSNKLKESLSYALTLTVAKEELNPLLNDSLFKPVLPGKSTTDSFPAEIESFPMTQMIVSLFAK